MLLARTGTHGVNLNNDGVANGTATVILAGQVHVQSLEDVRHPVMQWVETCECLQVLYHYVMQMVKKHQYHSSQEAIYYPCNSNLLILSTSANNTN